MTTDTEALPPLLPCPFCGEAAQLTTRPDNRDGTEFFAAVACYCGGYSACAHKMAVRPTQRQATEEAAQHWNTRAALAQRQQVPDAPFLFVAMDDDKQAHLTWCADEAAVREAVKGAMFWLLDGEELDADHAEQLDGSVAELLQSGALTFEGDAPLYLYRVAAAPALTAAPSAQAEPQEPPAGCYPEEWGPSSDRRLTCACGNPDPSHWQNFNAAPPSAQAQPQEQSLPYPRLPLKVWSRHDAPAGEWWSNGRWTLKKYLSGEGWVLRANDRIVGVWDDLSKAMKSAEALAQPQEPPRCAPLTAYKQCSKHEGTPYTMTVTAAVPARFVCPNCEQERGISTPEEQR